MDVEHAPYPVDDRLHLVLQDFDKVAKSNLSTCLLLWAADLLKPKVRAVASRLNAAGFTAALVERRFGSEHRIMVDEPTTALFGVDNVDARRDLDTAEFSLVVEAWLGSGYRGFATSACTRTRGRACRHKSGRPNPPRKQLPS